LTPGIRAVEERGVSGSASCAGLTSWVPGGNRPPHFVAAVAVVVAAAVVA